MVVKSILQPRQFFFQCPKCGRYHVSEAHLYSFLAPPLQERLDQKFERGANTAILELSPSCPNCDPEGVYRVKLVTETPPSN